MPSEPNRTDTSSYYQIEFIRYLFCKERKFSLNKQIYEVKLKYENYPCHILNCTPKVGHKSLGVQFMRQRGGKSLNIIRRL